MTSSATIHTVDEVFGITRNLPLNYAERSDVDGRLRDELAAAHHVVIYGSSKQGKTSLRKRCMDSSEYILVQCSNRSDIADLHSNILKRAGFEITLSQKRSSSGRHKVVASLKAAVKATLFGQGVQTEATAGAERETTTGTEHTTAALELDIDDVNDVIAALQGIGFHKKIVLEDFHYLDFQVQRDFAVELKAFHEASDITFVIVGVWLEDNRLIVYNGDLTGRVVSINADRWSMDELREVIDTGGALLGVSFADIFKAALLVLARESIYVVQEVCRRACLGADIRRTVNDNPIIGADVDVDALVKQVVDEQSARYDGFLSTFAAGFQETELQMHKWLLYPLLTTNADRLKQGLKYRDIKNILREKHPREGELNSGNITQSLQSSASLQVKRNIMPIVIDYDQSSKTLYVVDKGFLIWLHHQNAADLLDDIGLPID
ncbi:hypothetical protein [Burkholderia sp. Bp9015]|uniref:hypothetical protein n=1 Tax=Burkholderia sp. Bp9015 TaxID=2184563 RepID=UPI000F5A2FB4|nr:hypothetical protein [Burkholderia sp. Bp9015]RQR75232.1 hypothetical protein DIE12_09905 [Burkholderia sp. Bp9015]